MQAKTKYQVKCRLKKGDEVIVLAGKYKGETAKIDAVDRKYGRVYLASLNMAKRHTKPNLASPEGGIVEKVMPFPVSKVALYDSKKKKATRVGYKTDGKKKTRVAKLSGTALE